MSTYGDTSAGLRVVTWNIRFGLEIDRALAEVGSTPELRDADVWLLQELDDEGAARFAEGLGARHAYSSVAPHPATGRPFGNAVVTRWPIRASSPVPLPHVAAVSGHPRAATRAEVLLGERAVTFVSAHTEIPSLPLSKRVEQFDAVAGADVGRVGPTVVGGDFNTVTRRGIRALTRTMTARGLSPVEPDGDATTFDRFGRRMRLDHLFQRGFSVRGAGVIGATASSDHRPVWVVLEPAPRADDV